MVSDHEIEVQDCVKIEDCLRFHFPADAGAVWTYSGRYFSRSSTTWKWRFGQRVNTQRSFRSRLKWQQQNNTNSIMDDIPPVLGNEPQIPMNTKTITVLNFTRSNIRSSRHSLNLGTGEHRDGRINDLASDFRPCCNNGHLRYLGSIALCGCLEGSIRAKKQCNWCSESICEVRFCRALWICCCLSIFDWTLCQ